MQAQTKVHSHVPSIYARIPNPEHIEDPATLARHHTPYPPVAICILIRALFAEDLLYRNQL
jgi:hypothetical protein